MFDNQLTGTTGKGQAPSNLPMGEPEDMFSSVTGDEVGGSEEQPSALEAGVLKPKSQPIPAQADAHTDNTEPVDSSDFEVMAKVPREQVRRVVPSPAAAAPAAYPEYRIQEPSIIKSVFLVILVILVVAGVGFGGWWAYGAYIAPRLDNSGAAPISSSEETNNLPSPTVSPSSELTEDIDHDSNPAYDAILFGSVPDTDGDGIDELKEKEL